MRPRFKNPPAAPGDCNGTMQKSRAARSAGSNTRERERERRKTVSRHQKPCLHPGRRYRKWYLSTTRLKKKEDLSVLDS